MGLKSSKTLKLPPEDLNFLMQNTCFTKKQIKKWYKGFIKDCPCGQLSRKKFIEVYSGFFPDGNAEEFCTHVFRTFDKDNSGKIDFNEFLLAINITSSGKPEEKLNWAFQMYDIDGNGTIEKNEMEEIIKAIYIMLGTNVDAENMTPEKRTEEIFDKMDINHDGVLEKEEFINGCMADKQLYSILLADEAPEDVGEE
ncbi:neuronal calcium sensor 2-like [Lineus longissimus]|uniref:neuronal calcium sensor 2-like n=1 Tax=Lineus longissimus TaxID=88925 RepID=UPI00315D4BDE